MRNSISRPWNFVFLLKWPLTNNGDQNSIFSSEIKNPPKKTRELQAEQSFFQTRVIEWIYNPKSQLHMTQIIHQIPQQQYDNPKKKLKTPRTNHQETQEEIMKIKEEHAYL